MCEFCKKNEVTVERLDSDESDPCEWISEEADPGACAAIGDILRFRMVRRGSSVRPSQACDRKRDG